MNISRFIKNTQKWNIDNSIQNIFRLSERFADIQLDCYVLLANMVDTEEQINEFPAMNNVLNEIIKMIAYLAKKLSLKDKTRIFRREIYLNETSQFTNQVVAFDNGYNLIELMLALYNFALNDKIKQLIYFDYKIKKSIKFIILNGNSTEIDYGLRLLAQLCFDRKICEDVLEEKELFGTLKEFLQTKKEEKNLLEYTKAILRVMKMNGFKDEIFDGLDQSKQKKRENRHTLVLSYSKLDKDEIDSIKNKLDEVKSQVKWDFVYESSLEEIKNSKIVLICLSQAFKKSVSCRLEIEHAFRLKKTIVPLLLQEEFKPNEW